MLPREEVLRRFDSLRQAVMPGGRRAPHKPLFVLYLLGRLQQRGKDASPLAVPYAEADRHVSPLIEEFGPTARGKHRAAMPFFHLDRSIWSLERDGLEPRHGRLRDAEAVGMLDADVQRALQRDPSLLAEVARRLIEANFPESYTEAICAETGLRLDEKPVADRPRQQGKARRRSADFRREVLRAYGGRCAFCGFDGEAWTGGLTKAPVGVAGAHVQWHALGGPDEVRNGLALCDLHHTLFDRGLVGVDEGRRVVVSDDFHARSEAAQALVWGVRGEAVDRFLTRAQRVEDERFAWHRAQVFRASAA